MVEEKWVLKMDEMLWQIEQTSCKPVLKDCIDWFEGVIDADKCDFNDDDFDVIALAIEARLREFKARVIH